MAIQSPEERHRSFSPRSEEDTILESSLESFPASDPPAWVFGKDTSPQPRHSPRPELVHHDSTRTGYLARLVLRFRGRTRPPQDDLSGTTPSFLELDKRVVASTLSRPKIVIIGGGFGGLAVAKHLRHAEADITLIDRRNFHLFQPLLYQVATGGLSPANISVPLRAALKKQKNTTVLLGEVASVDVRQKIVVLRDEKRIPFDFLVVAAGSDPNYFGHQEWQPQAPGLKTIEDAIEIRRRVLSLFEEAELESDSNKQRALLRFVVVGGGPTGVELAGALGEIANQTLRGNFRHLDPAIAEILIVEGSSQILSGYKPWLVNRAKAALARLGVSVREQTLVKDVGQDYLMVDAQGKLERIDSRCILWAAGVKASPLGANLATQVGVATDSGGRVPVNTDFSLPGYTNVFVIGDLARLTQDGKPVQGVAPAAIQAGKYVADVLQKRIKDPEFHPLPFKYHDKGIMTSIGRAYGVAQLRRVAFAGFGAWLLWLWVHIVYLTQFTNRMLVVIQWGWNYFTFNRSARLITNPSTGDG
jgi:NADH dehydrogenase